MIGGFRDEYAFLSNFYPCQIWFGDRTTTSVEHAYQAAKAALDTQRDDILNAPTPGKAKRLGRDVQLRLGWEAEKVEIMLALLRQKFKDPMLRKQLLATGHHELVEVNNWGDTFWGWCEGVGQNMLGKLLMQVREEVYFEESDKVSISRSQLKELLAGFEAALGVLELEGENVQRGRDLIKRFDAFR